MAEIGLPVPEVIEVGTPPAEDDGKGVGDNGLIPILSVTVENNNKMKYCCILPI